MCGKLQLVVSYKSWRLDIQGSLSGFEPFF